MSRRVLAIGAVVLGTVAVAGGVAAVVGGLGPARPAAAPGPARPPATAVVTRQDLTDQQSEDGTLGYGDHTRITAGGSGTLTWLPAEGAGLRRGSTAYRLDGRPVTLMYGSLPLWRPLRIGASGADVRQLERNLRALGHTGFTVDSRFSASTAAAVRAWQRERKLDVTGTVDPAQVVIRPGAVRVGKVEAALGDRAGPGAAVVTVTATGRRVTVPLAVADERLARTGARVDVELPGGTIVPGTVISVGTVATVPKDGGAADATVSVTIRPRGKAVAGAVDQAPVTVRFTSSTAKDVLTVPVAALLALQEGGYGVQVVSGGVSRIVGVGTGLFADGRVEVSGGGIAAGTRVGVPAE